MQNFKQTVSESKLDILDEETIFIKAYNNRLTSLFEYISQLTWMEYNDFNYKKNLTLYSYSMISETHSQFKDKNFLLSPCTFEIWWENYQIFDKYKVEDLINDENEKTLKHIMSWELLVFFSDDFENIYLVCKDIYVDIKSKMFSILIN